MFASFSVLKYQFMNLEGPRHINEKNKKLCVKVILSASYYVCFEE